MDSSAYQAGEAFTRTLVVLLLSGALIGGGIFFIIALVKSFTRQTRGWIIGAAVSGILALVGMFGLVGVMAKFVSKGVVAAREARAAKATTKSLSPPDDHFQIRVPTDWKPMPELNKSASLGAGSFSDDQYVIVGETLKSDFAGSLEDFAKLSSDEVLESLEDGKVTGPEKRDLKKYPALHYKITGKVGLIRLAYSHTSLETPHAFYQIMAWTLPSRESEAEPVFREIVESFTTDFEFAVTPGTTPPSSPEEDPPIEPAEELPQPEAPAATPDGAR